MKKLTLLLGFICLTMMSFSCSKTQINDAKLSVAEKAGAATEQVLVKEYAKFPELLNLDCPAEAKVVGLNVQHELERVFKADTSEVNKSLQAEVLQLACKGAVAKVLPLVFGSQFQGYPCANIAVSGKLEALGDNLCQKIKL